ncbi:hypothetical protein B0O80DRAFT_195227 [Mortierella sp. GBAus27b]|nr:hypothetical protein B0O80DRAFT_195227 [Mortierella sp. GBAus27b]
MSIVSQDLFSSVQDTPSTVFLSDANKAANCPTPCSPFPLRNRPRLSRLLVGTKIYSLATPPSPPLRKKPPLSRPADSLPSPGLNHSKSSVESREGPFFTLPPCSSIARPGRGRSGRFHGHGKGSVQLDEISSGFFYQPWYLIKAVSAQLTLPPPHLPTPPPTHFAPPFRSFSRSLPFPSLPNLPESPLRSIPKPLHAETHSQDIQLVKGKAWRTMMTACLLGPRKRDTGKRKAHTEQGNNTHLHGRSKGGRTVCWKHYISSMAVI